MAGGVELAEEELEPEQLWALLTQTAAAASLLLIDCSPAVTYNASHIEGASHFLCTSLILRRYAGEDALLQHIIPENRLPQFLDNEVSCVVIYNGSGCASCRATKRAVHTLKAVKARHHLDTSLSTLKGGFLAFQAKYPELCTRPDTPPLQLSFSANSAAASPSLAKSAMLPNPLCLSPAAIDTFLAKSPKPSLQPPLKSPLRRENVSPINMPLETHKFPVRITSGVYLGSAYHASRDYIMAHLGITAVLNVSNSVPNYFLNKYIYHRVHVDDSSTAELLTCFNTCNQFIDRIVSNGGRVLVHCQAGVSRSPSVCLAYLMYKKHIQLNIAFESLYQKRNLINPNLNFMCQLLEYEKTLFAYSNKRCFTAPVEGTSRVECDGGGGGSPLSPKPPKITRKSEGNFFVF